MRPSRAASCQRQCGFTLVEVLIVATLIGIIASIAVPTFVSRRMTANETAVISTLRSIAKAQFQFHAMAAIDVNRDGAAEYGFMNELTGKSNMRGQDYPLAPNLISLTLSAVGNTGRVRRSGYYLAMYLPGAGGVGLAETDSNRTLVEPSLARDYWTVLAWPTDYSSTGKASYFINQQGQILRSYSAGYSGDNAPPPGAGLAGIAATHINSQQLAIGTAGADGHLWTVLN